MTTERPLTSDEVIKYLHDNSGFCQMLHELRQTSDLAYDEFIIDYWTNKLFGEELREYENECYDHGVHIARALIGAELLSDGDPSVRLIRKYSPRSGDNIIYAVVRLEKDSPARSIFEQIINQDQSPTSL